MLHHVRDYYDGRNDIVYNALNIASHAVADDVEGEGIAEGHLMSMGYILGGMINWELSAEMHRKIEQLRGMIFPELEKSAAE
jgi:hypothetical protein